MINCTVHIELKEVNNYIVGMYHYDERAVVSSSSLIKPLLFN